MQGRPKMKCMFFPCEIKAFTMCTQGGDVVEVANESFTPLRTKGTINLG
jgi:hypothetical protein